MKRFVTVFESKYYGYNDTLSEEFWSGKSFDQDVRLKLINICRDFINKIKIVSFDDIQDIVLTGSLANYNYTDYSDLDVHIIIDYSSISHDIELLKLAFNGEKFKWNLKHDIMINGHEVELYVQDVNEPHFASGTFSLLRDEWIVEPLHNQPEIDDDLVAEKVRDLKRIIQDLCAQQSKDNTPEENRKYYELCLRKMKKLKKMRQRGLEREGEFSIENLTFKVLRNIGTIKKLVDCTNHFYDKIFSY